jgi:sulfate adenylyltransferase subunit 1 (EFTu-like GTPase family)
LPVQRVHRPNADFRGLCGTLASGVIRVGDDVVALPSEQGSRIASILGPGGAIAAAYAGDAITVTLEHALDVARGDMLAAPRARPQAADQFAAHLVWMSEHELLPGRSYLMKINHATIATTVTELKHRIDVNDLSKLANSSRSSSILHSSNALPAIRKGFTAGRWQERSKTSPASISPMRRRSIPNCISWPGRRVRRSLPAVSWRN